MFRFYARLKQTRLLRFCYFLGLLAPMFAFTQSDYRGLIFGEVLTDGGQTYKGFIRWGSEEAYWGDLFNSSKGESPYKEYARGPSNLKKFKIFKYTVTTSRNSPSTSRIFTTPFGNIAQIEVTGPKQADVLMKSGSVYEVSGYANDVGTKLNVFDEGLGEIEIAWKDVRTVRFMNGPQTSDYKGGRLYGTVKTTGQQFTGFVQWDKQEAMTEDRLDGHSRDGKMSIKFSQVSKIQKRGGNACEVTLRDGRSLNLRDNKDVSSRNRGLFVEMEDQRRVLVPWQEFISLTLVETPSTGPAYADFSIHGPITGSVIEKNGNRHQGSIVYDLDERELWENLNGQQGNLEYHLPFKLIKSIEPEREDGSWVYLKSGEKYFLEDAADVNSRNLGILIFTQQAEEPVYVAWEDLARVELD